MRKLILMLVMGMFFTYHAFATPSTQIWNPSTDIQPYATLHMGIDNYFTSAWPQDGGYGMATDVGLTYGVLPGLEIGADFFAPSSTQIKFNIKYGIPESEIFPAFAVGGMNFGFDTMDGARSNDDNIVYSLIAKTLPIGRLTAGYYAANKYLYVDEDGDEANTGFILTWDKVLTDKVWACIDYASGYSLYGSTFYGVSYLFAPNVSVIFGYGTFNNYDLSKPVITTQLDINI